MGMGYEQGKEGREEDVLISLAPPSVRHARSTQAAARSGNFAKRIDIIVLTGLGFSGFSGLRVLEFFVRVSGRVSGLIY